MSSVFTGCIPALMTPCTAERKPDFEALVRMGKKLMGDGMSGVVYCGSMGDWPLLTDAERQEGVRRLAEAGVPVIVGTGAQNTAAAVAHAAHAQKAHFAAVLAAAPKLPAVIYNSPYYGYETKADLFFALRAAHANLVGFKEFGGGPSLSYAAANITAGDKGLCERAAKGDAQARALAAELDKALAVLSSFDEGPDLVLFYKHLMVMEGHKEYALHFNESDRLSPSQQAYAEEQHKLFKTWYANWAGKGK